MILVEPRISQNYLTWVTFLRRISPSTRFVAFAERANARETSHIVSELDGYLSKSLSGDELIECVGAIHLGRRIASAPLQPRLISPLATTVLQGVSLGMTDEELSSSLHAHPTTIEKQRRELLASLGVANDRELIAIAQLHGLLPETASLRLRLPMQSEESDHKMADRLMRRKKRGCRPSKVEGFRQWTQELLFREPTLPTLEALRRARENGFDGSKSAFYAMAAGLRPPTPPKPPAPQSADWPLPPQEVARHHQSSWTPTQVETRAIASRTNRAFAPSGRPPHSRRRLGVQVCARNDDHELVGPATGAPSGKSWPSLTFI